MHSFMGYNWAYENLNFVAGYIILISGLLVSRIPTFSIKRKQFFIQSKLGYLIMICKICRSDAASSFETLDKKIYWSCNFCGCKYLDKYYFIDPVEEEQRYLEHNNEINDTDYRTFLSRLSEPLKEKISFGIMLELHNQMKAQLVCPIKQRKFGWVL